MIGEGVKQVHSCCGVILQYQSSRVLLDTPILAGLSAVCTLYADLILSARSAADAGMLDAGRWRWRWSLSLDGDGAGFGWSKGAKAYR